MDYHLELLKGGQLSFEAQTRCESCESLFAKSKYLFDACPICRSRRLEEML